jgi:hypothetical protein
MRLKADVQLRSAKPGRHGIVDQMGLYLKVKPSLRRSWIFRYERGAKEHFMGLGPYPDVSLHDACEAAKKYRALLRNGSDPMAARDAESSASALVLKQQAAELKTFDEGIHRGQGARLEER